MKKSAEFKKNNGFWVFAWLPTELISGETVWLKYYFVGGSRHGVSNRFDRGDSRYELKYSCESARATGN